jgi:hypothetical protein
VLEKLENLTKKEQMKGTHRRAVATLSSRGYDAKCKKHRV